MAVGEDTVNAGWPLVQESGENGRVRWGAREINRTRDLASKVQGIFMDVWPVSDGGTGATERRQAKVNLGITCSTAEPPAKRGNNGDLWFQVTS